MILTAQMIALLGRSTQMTELMSGIELSTCHPSRPKNGGRPIFKQNKRRQARRAR